jgi:hypothetical protein
LASSNDELEVLALINVLFDEGGRLKNFAKLKDIQLDIPEFSSFSDLPPYNLKNYSETLILEELRFSSISDYQYEILKPQIDIFENIAIAKFRLKQKGMLVDNKSFTGKQIIINGRATFVLIKKESWKIIHFHLDQIPE